MERYVYGTRRGVQWIAAELQESVRLLMGLADFDILGPNQRSLQTPLLPSLLEATLESLAFSVSISELLAETSML